MLLTFQAKVRDQQEKETKRKNWVNNVDIEPTRPTPKPIDEDLYKISPEVIYAKVNKVQPLTPLLLFSP